MASTNHHLRSLTFNQTFESSLMENTTEKFKVDKSLLKGIRKNDASMIIDQNGGVGDPNNQQVFDQCGELSSIAIATRKQYDQVRTEAMIYQQTISKLKKQKLLLEDEQSKLQEIAKKQKKQFDDTNRLLEEVTALMDSTIFQRDIHSNVKSTVKVDLLVFKKRCFDRDVKLMRENSKLKSIKIEHESKLKLNRRCRQMVHSVEKSAHKNALERTQKFQSFTHTLDRKRNHAYSKQARLRYLHESMIQAINDKLPQEKEWSKILSCNLFLKQFLRKKMQKLMNRYMAVEISFHKMKQATSIKNCNQLITKFLNREQTYGGLLGSIEEKERCLQALKQERSRLQKVNRNLTYQNDEIEVGNKQALNDGRNSTDSILADVNEKLMEISKKQQQMYQYSIRFLSVFFGNSTRDQLIESYPKTQKIQILLVVLEEVKKFLSKSSLQNNFQEKVQSAFYENSPQKTIMSEAVIKRNTRITTNSTIQNDSLDAFDEKDMAYDDISEVDFIQHNRRSIKKNDLHYRKFRIKSKPN